MRTVLAVVLAVVVGIPTGWIIAMMLTPLLWKLEGVLHVELAGHSGPRDEIIILIWVLVVSALFLLFRFKLLRRKESQNLPHTTASRNH